MTREEAIAKIKKLQALKEGANKIGSDGEAAQASKIIDKLQKQFGITMEEVNSWSEKETNSGKEENHSEEDQKIKDNIFTIQKNVYVHLCEIIDNGLESFGNMKTEKLLNEITNEMDCYYNWVCKNEKINRICNKYGIVLRDLVNESFNDSLDYLKERACKLELKADNQYFKKSKNEKVKEGKTYYKGFEIMGLHIPFKFTAVALIVFALCVAHAPLRFAQKSNNKKEVKMLYTKKDSVLEKVKQSGVGSLSESEKKIYDNLDTIQRKGYATVEEALKERGKEPDS